MGEVTTEITQDGYNIAGSERKNRGSLTMSDSYDAGGDTFTVRQLGLISVSRLEVWPVSGYVLQVDLANSKIKAFDSAGSETTPGTDLSAQGSTIFEAYGA